MSIFNQFLTGFPFFLFGLPPFGFDLMILDHEGFSMFYSGLAVFPLTQHRLHMIEGCQLPLGSFPLVWRQLLGLSCLSNTSEPFYDPLGYFEGKNDVGNCYLLSIYSGLYSTFNNITPAMIS